MSAGAVILALGGLAVADRAAWERAAVRVEHHRALGHPVVVVLDPLPGVASRLERLVHEAVRDAHEPALQALATRHLQLARELEVDADAAAGAELAALSRLALSVTLAGEADPRVRARIRALGPTLLLRLVTPWLARRLPEAQAVDPGELLRVGLGRDAGHYLDARPLVGFDAELAARLAGHPLLVTAAGVAADFAGDPVVLGRAGPERGAAALATRLGADLVEAWLDGGAVWSAPPAAGGAPVEGLGPLAARGIAAARRDLDPRALAHLATAGIDLILHEPGHPGTRLGPDEPAGGVPALVTGRPGLLATRVAGLPSVALVEALGRHPARLHAVAAAGESTMLVLDPEGTPLDEDEQADLLRELAPWNPSPLRAVGVLYALGGLTTPPEGVEVLAGVSPGPGVQAWVVPAEALGAALGAGEPRPAG